VLRVNKAGRGGDRRLRPVARLSAGKTITAANDDLTVVAGRRASAYRDDEGWSARVVPLREVNWLGDTAFESRAEWPLNV